MEKSWRKFEKILHCDDDNVKISNFQQHEPFKPDEFMLLQIQKYSQNGGKSSLFFLASLAMKYFKLFAYK